MAREGTTGELMAGAWKKHCGCGVVYTREEWADLQFKGMQYVEADDSDPTPEGDAYTLELRDCNCGSTLAVDAEENNV